MDALKNKTFADCALSRNSRAIIAAVTAGFTLVLAVAITTTILYLKTRGIADLSAFDGALHASLSSLPTMVVATGIGALVLLLGLFYLLVIALIKAQKLKIKQKTLQESLNTEKHNVEIADTIVQNATKTKNAYLDALACMTLELDLHGHILHANLATQNVIGDSTVIPGKKLFSALFNAQDQDRIQKRLKDIGKTKTHHSQALIKCNGDQSKTVDMTLMLLQTDRGQDPKIIATLIDTDTHQRTQKALRNTELNYRIMMENSAFGFYQIFPDGMFKSVDSTLAKILNFGSIDELNTNIQHVFNDLYCHEADKKHILHHLEQHGVIHAYECQVKSHGGVPLWISQTLRAIKNEYGKVDYYEGSIENIDKRKKAEIALQDAKNKSDLANRSKSEFLAHMSHELRTPLNAIIGFSDILKIQNEDQLNLPTVQSYANDIHTSGKHLLKMINEILDIAKIEMNEQQLLEQEIDLTQTVNLVVDLQKTKIESKHLSIETHLKDNLVLIADETALKQIVLNLLTNAIKFTPDHGVITLETKVNSANSIVLSITDTGNGLSDEEIQNALSPFGKNPAVVDYTQASTGLGLTLTKALIELHHGTIDMISKRAIGTTVIVTFPPQRTGS